MSEKWDDWKREVLEPLLEDSQELIDPDAPVVILSADADRVQDYVFESARLPEIRGASMLLQDLNKKAAEKISEAVDPRCVIYQGGGSLLALVPDDVQLLRQLKSEIEALYPRQTEIATTTCIYHRTTVGQLLAGYGEFTREEVNALRKRHPAEWQRIAAGYGVYDENGAPPDEVSPKAFDAHRGFGQLVKLAGMKLRRRKDDRSLVPFYETLPHAQRCRSCGQRPATERYHWYGEENTPLCRPCYLKIKGRRDTRSFWMKRFEDSLGDTARRSAYYAGYTSENVGIANDLNEIGQDCETRTGKRYVGFIYADGNSVGRLLETCQTITDFQQISEALRKATAEAVYRALAELARPAKVKREESTPPDDVVIHPFEILAIGGDDVLLIVPGDLALPLAARICELFGQGMEELSLPDGAAVSMSAGVVIADAHNPVRILRDVAAQLLKGGAKRRTHDDGKPAVDFLILKSQSMLRRDVDDLRAAYPIKLPDETSGSALRLTSAPYTLEEMKIILNLLRRMRKTDFPKSQLQQLIEALHRGRMWGSLHFLYQKVRHRDRRAGKIFDAITEKWPFEKWDPIPWNRVRDDPDSEVKYTTILPDLADLYDLVPGSKDLERWDIILGEVS